MNKALLLASGLLLVASCPSVAQAEESCPFEEAQTTELAKSFLKARRLYAACAQASCAEDVQELCSSKLKALLQQQPSIVVLAKESSGQYLTGGTVLVDGQPLGKLDGMAIELDPGPHKVRIEVPEREPVERDIVLAEGTKNERVDVVVAPLRAKSQPPPKAPPPKRGGPHPVAWVLGGVGLAGLAAGGALWIAGAVGESDLVEHGSTREDIDGVYTLKLAGDVSMGIGGAFAVASVIALVVWAAEPAPSEPGGVAAAGVSVTVSPVDVKVRF